MDSRRGERMNADVPPALYFVWNFFVSEIRIDVFS